MSKAEDKSLLWRTRTYLVGHMQYASGRDWREYVETELHDLNIITFNPYKKPAQNANIHKYTKNKSSSL